MALNANSPRTSVALDNITRSVPIEGVSPDDEPQMVGSEQRGCPSRCPSAEGTTATTGEQMSPSQQRSVARAWRH